MIPSRLSLVPLNPARRAAMQAVAEVERRLAQGKPLPEFPYACAFFRYLKGSRRVTLREIHYFAPVLSAQEFRGSRAAWLNAIDALIESRGACCYLPLPESSGRDIFPEVRFRQTERGRRQDELRDEKYSRQRRREEMQRERAYQALAGQAEIELAFHTPATVSSWSAKWSGSRVRQYDMEEMFWRWSERFPSLAELDRSELTDSPFWGVIFEAGQLAKEATRVVVQMERWMVPNKLMLQEAS